MKENIKQILREGINKNSLGVAITRPNQELIVMRGIPGSGKSTKAKELAGSNGVIHSTDDVIQSQGDYREFFEKMIASKDFSPLSKAHRTNVKNLIDSIKKGISPVILDNTNIKHNEPKEAVKSALELGLSDENIKFVDIGTGGLSAEELSKRNTHGVPLDKINSMIDSHAGQGPISVDSVMNSKDMYGSSNISYSAVVLDEKSRFNLLSKLDFYIPDDWKVIAHHMTIKLGALEDKSDIGKTVTLIATEFGMSNMAFAVKVEGYPSKNEKPHITIAINPDGGKPVMSNNIKEWRPLKKPIKLKGVVTEIHNK